MNAYGYLVILAGVFGILPVIWKAKGAHIFMLLAVGEALSLSAAYGVTAFISERFYTTLPLRSIVAAGLLLAPPLLGLLVSRGSVKKKKEVYHIAPALVSGGLAYLWFIKTLPADSYQKLATEQITVYMHSWQSTAIGVAIVSILALMITERPKPDEDKKKK